MIHLLPSTSKPDDANQLMQAAPRCSAWNKATLHLYTVNNSAATFWQQDDAGHFMNGSNPNFFLEDNSYNSLQYLPGMRFFIIVFSWNSTECKIWRLSIVYSLAGPVVGYGAVQRYSVAEVRVVTVLLPQVFSVALLGWRQSGREAAFTPTPEALNQTQRFGQTWVRQTRLPVKIL